MQKYLLAIFAGLGATLAITLLAASKQLTSEYYLLMAPFGASAVLLFALPDSPLAQAKNVILGHLLTALIGLIILKVVGVSALTLGLATGLAITAMMLTGTTHPPAGATPLVIMLTEQDWLFLLSPVLLGAVTMVVIGKAMHKLRQRLPALSN